MRMTIPAGVERLDPETIELARRSAAAGSSSSAWSPSTTTT